MVLEEQLGGQVLEPLPSLEEHTQEAPTEYIEQATELADEYLGDDGEEGRLKRAVHDALSTARTEFS
jgi:hypothetical protein